MTARRWLGLAALLAVVLVGGRLVASTLVDYRWYESLGPGPLSVWRARVTDLVALRLGRSGLHSQVLLSTRASETDTPLMQAFLAVARRVSRSALVGITPLG